MMIFKHIWPWMKIYANLILSFLRLQSLKLQQTISFDLGVHFWTSTYRWKLCLENFPMERVQCRLCVILLLGKWLQTLCAHLLFGELKTHFVVSNNRFSVFLVNHFESTWIESTFYKVGHIDYWNFNIQRLFIVFFTTYWTVNDDFLNIFDHTWKFM